MACNYGTVGNAQMAMDDSCKAPADSGTTLLVGQDQSASTRKTTMAILMAGLILMATFAAFMGQGERNVGSHDESQEVPGAPTSLGRAVATQLSSDVTFTIDGSDTKTTLESTMFGTNVPYYLGNITDTPAILMETAGVQYLRFPGGSSANFVIWNDDYSNYSYFSDKEASVEKGMSTDEFITLCKKMGAQPIVEINAAVAFVYGAESAAELATSWYAYFKKEGLPVTWWEFGNENYGHWEKPYGDYTVNGTVYGEAFSTVYDALEEEADGDTFYLGIVMYTSNSSSGAVIADWNLDIVNTDATMKENAFLIIHNYFSEESSAVAVVDYSTFTSTVSQAWTIKSYLVDLVKSYQPSSPWLTNGKKVFMTEYNMIEAPAKHGGCGALNKYMNAAWHSQLLTKIIGEDVYAGLFAFGWENGDMTCEYTNWGASSTFGTVSEDDYTPYPVFYTYALYNSTLVLGSDVVSASSSDSHVTVLGTVDGSTIRIIATNLLSSAVSLTVNISGVTGFESGTDVSVETNTILPYSTSDENGFNSSQLSWNGHHSSDGDAGPYIPTTGLADYSPDTTTATMEGSIISLSDLPGYGIVGIVLTAQ